MPKLTETFANKLPPAKSGTDKDWDSEMKGLVLFVGKKSKTWFFQKGVRGRTQRKLIGHLRAAVSRFAWLSAIANSFR